MESPLTDEETKTAEPAPATASPAPGPDAASPTPGASETGVAAGEESAGWRRFVPRRELWPLIAALVIYLFLGAQHVAWMIPKGVGNYDSLHYEAMTKQWVRTGVYGYYADESPGVSNAVVPPGYPAFLAPFYALSGQTAPGLGGPYAAIFYTQLLFGVGFLVFTWLFARRIAGVRAAGVAVVILACMESFYSQPSYILTQLLATTLFMGYLVLLARALDKGKVGWAIAAGLVFALTMLTRPTTLPAALVPLVLGLTPQLRARWKTSAIVLGALAVGMAPWLIRNFLQLHRVTPITGRDETILAGIDPYYRAGLKPGVTSGRSALDYSNLVKRHLYTGTKLDFAFLRLGEYLRRMPLELLGWFTIGKIQYIAFDTGPAANTTWAINSILRSGIGILGLVGSVLSVRMRNLLPTALMVFAWAALNAVIVPDQRYWFDMYPLLATLSGAVLVTVWDAARRAPAAPADGAPAGGARADGSPTGEAPAGGAA
jgi:hypothetical protein